MSRGCCRNWTGGGEHRGRPRGGKVRRDDDGARRAAGAGEAKRSVRGIAVEHVVMVDPPGRVDRRIQEGTNR